MNVNSPILMKCILLISFINIVNCAHNDYQDHAKDPHLANDRSLANATSTSELNRLQDNNPNYNYEVLFTNPECLYYNYTQEVRARNNEVLIHKPKNTFCSSKNDLENSGKRTISPQYRIIEWINDPRTKEIYFTYLTFRNDAVIRALCDKLKSDINFKLRFVISTPEDTDPSAGNASADKVIACAQNKEQAQYKMRGLTGGIGYAHNKFFIVNPHADTVRISFSSGNMTSGAVLHHENWHFITTNKNKFFAKMHTCVFNAEWDEVSGQERKAFINAVSLCRENSRIDSPEESDIKVFFVPGEGEPEKGLNKNGYTAWEYMNNGKDGKPGINSANTIDIGAHRFFYARMLAALNTRLNSNNKPMVRIVADDDTFYVANDKSFTVGSTMPAEWNNINQLQKKGAKIKFMETNSTEHQLHHSKFLLFNGATPDQGAVLCGAANLTSAAFTKNWENIYYITIPSVVKAFYDQYEYTWNNLATAPDRLPRKGIVDSVIKASENP